MALLPQQQICILSILSVIVINLIMLFNLPGEHMLRHNFVTGVDNTTLFHPVFPCVSSKSVSETCAFMEHKGYDFPGYDFDNAAADSLPECASLCFLQQPRCAVFSVVNGRCYLKESTALQRSTISHNVDSGTMPQLLFSVGETCISNTQCASSHCYEQKCGTFLPCFYRMLVPGFYFSSYALKVVQAKNSNECSLHCCHEKFCSAFTFFHKSSECRLFTLSALDMIGFSSNLSTSGVLETSLSDSGSFCVHDFSCKSRVCKARQCFSRESKNAQKHGKSTKNVVLSLTTSPGRLPMIDLTLSSLLTQTLRPARMIVFLPERFGRDGSTYDWSAPVIARMQASGIEFISVTRDLGPATKIAPLISLVKDLNTWLVAVDDDIFYPPYLVEDLVAEGNRLLSLQESVGAVGVSCASFHGEDSSFSYKRVERHGQPADMVEAFAGAAYFRTAFGNNEDFSSYLEDANSNINCLTSDDVVLSNWVRLHRAQVRVVNTPRLNFPSPNIEELYVGLGSDALKNGAGGSGLGNTERYWKCIEHLRLLGISSY